MYFQLRERAGGVRKKAGWGPGLCKGPEEVRKRTGGVEREKKGGGGGGKEIRDRFSKSKNTIREKACVCVCVRARACSRREKEQ